jgi:hypothetical protein
MSRIVIHCDVSLVSKFELLLFDDVVDVLVLFDRTLAGATFCFA